jgi:hypothetical protein
MLIILYIGSYDGLTWSWEAWSASERW